MTDWLPMAGGDLDRAVRWEQCCWDRYQAASESYKSARAELEEAAAAHDTAERELNRIRFSMGEPHA